MSNPKYKAHVAVEGSLEETIFESLDGAAQLAARYVCDAEKHGAFEHGKVYELKGGAEFHEIEEHAGEFIGEVEGVETHDRAFTDEEVQQDYDARKD